MNDSFPPARPAPPLSITARRRLALAAWFLIGACSALVVGLFAASRVVPSGRVGTGALDLQVQNGLPVPLCALHIGVASEHTSFSRDKLGSRALSPGATFTLTGLDPVAYRLRAWSCDGRAFEPATMDLAANFRLWTVLNEHLVPLP